MIKINGIALPASIFAGTSVFSFVLAFKFLNKKEVKASRFSAYDQKETEAYENYEKIIKKSNLPVKTAMTVILTGGILVGITTYIVLGVWWISLISTFAGFFFPKWYYQWHVASKQKLMASQMELTCEIIATVIKSGSSLPEGLEKAAKDVNDPLKTELMKTATQIRIGVSVSDAFMELTEKVGIPEMQVVSIAIQLKEKGMTINLPQLFMGLQKDIRESIQFRKEVSATTAEVKTAGFVVAAVPFATITMMRLFSPEFIAPLFNNPVGLIIFTLCTGIIVAGMRWMINMASIEV